MQVLPSPPRLPGPKTQNNNIPSRPAPPHDNPLQGDQFVFDFPSTYPQQPTELYELPADAPPKLDRPVLLVHGFNSGPETWKNMKTWLTSGGINKDGGVVDSHAHPAADGRVFSMQFSRPYNPLSNNATELRSAIDNICAATGASEVDVVAHSMGGLDTRLYLDQGNEKVKKLVMIATPNHGSVLADLELTFRELGLPIKPPTDNPLIRQTLTDLSEVRGDNNPTLAQLNKNWNRQRGRADMCVIAGNGKPTLKNRFWITVRGDGAVSQESAKMPDIPLYNIWTADHGATKEHPKALQMTAAFLTDRPMPLDDAEPPDTPPDQEITPTEIKANEDQLQYVIREERSAKR